MNYCAVYLLSRSILIIILVCEWSHQIAVPIIKDETFSAKTLKLYKTKCGGYPENAKIEEYITKCNGVDPTLVRNALDLGPDLCLGVINNIIASCDKKSYDVLDFLSETNPEKFNNLNINKSICPLETLEIKSFLSSVKYFNKLSDNLKDNRTCCLYCYDFNNNVKDDCNLWHKTNVILRTLKSQTNPPDNAAEPIPGNSDITSHSNDNKKLSAEQDLKPGSSSQLNTAPISVDTQQIVKNQTQIPSVREKGTPVAHEHTKIEQAIKSVGEQPVGNDELSDLTNQAKPSGANNKQVSNTKGEKAQPELDQKKGSKPAGNPNETENTKQADQQQNADQDKGDIPPETSQGETPDDGQSSFPVDKFEKNHDETDDKNLTSEPIPESEVGKNPEDYDRNEDYDDKNVEHNVNQPDLLLNTQQNENLPPVSQVKSDALSVPDNDFITAEDSHFFIYFLTSASIVILGYVAFHNKNKILAYALEGRRSRNSRRRPNSASYRKLECSLEEAITSNSPHSSVTNVVY